MTGRTKHSAHYLRTHARLLWRVTRTELVARYAGTVFGIAWAFLAPALVLTLYATVYIVILQVRVHELSPLQYTLFIFAGLVPFLSTSEALTQGIASVVANRALLSNTIFPIDLAPAKAVLQSQVVMTVGMAIIILGQVALQRASWTILLLPLVWSLHVLGLLGVVWFVSLFNALFRDLQMAIGALLMLLMIGSPIAYTQEMVPAGLRFIVYCNPFAHFVMAYQKVLVLGQVPTLLEWTTLVVLGLSSFVAGGYFFASMKKAVVDHV